MDMRGIRYFICLAECLNFTKAAKECFITQTAMSQHIANMEKELGFQLFSRNNRNVQLTTAGRDFYEQMKLLMHNYNNAVRHGQNMSQGGEGSIVITFPSCIEGLVFISRLRHFKSHYPTINLSVKIASPRYMLEQLKRGETDIAVCWPYDMAADDNISVQTLAEFKGNLICSRQHPLSGCKSVTLKQLQGERIAMVDLSGMPATQRVMYRDWKQLNLVPPTLPSFDHVNRMEELLLAVSIDNVVAIVPEFVRNNILANALSILEFDSPTPPMFQMGAGYLNTNTNPALHLALDVLRDSRIPMDY